MWKLHRRLFRVKLQEENLYLCGIWRKCLFVGIYITHNLNSHSKNNVYIYTFDHHFNDI